MTTGQHSSAGINPKVPSIGRCYLILPPWLMYTLITMVLWGGWGFISKPVAEKLSPWQVQTLSAVGLVPVIALLTLTKTMRAGPRLGHGLWLPFASGVIASVGNVAYYEALATGGKAADVTPLTALYPVVTIALAMIFLHERLNWIQMLGVLTSLTALYLFNAGADSAWLTPWLAMALIPILLWGTSALLQKCAATRGSGELVTVGFLLGTLPLSLLAPLWVSMNWRLPVVVWEMAFAVGLLFGLGNLTLIFAYGTGGKASVVTPMAGLYSLVTIPLAVLMLGERISKREGFGIALALAATLALSHEKPATAGPESAVLPNGKSRAA